MYGLAPLIGTGNARRLNEAGYSIGVPGVLSEVLKGLSDVSPAKKSNYVNPRSLWDGILL
jgi:hypothetical protein